jgi:hypothetical protein
MRRHALAKQSLGGCVISPYRASRTQSDNLRLGINPFRMNEETKMKILPSILILGALLTGCVTNTPPPARATTVVVPPSSGTTTVVVPQESGTAVVCRDGSRPPCY